MRRFLAAPLLRLAFYAAVLLAYGLAIAPGNPAVFSYDKANHALAFVVLAILARLGWPETPAWLIATGLIAFGGLIEVSQALPIIGRDASWGDLLADAVATIVGLGLVLTGEWLMRRLIAGRGR